MAKTKQREMNEVNTGADYAYDNQKLAQLLFFIKKLGQKKKVTSAIT